MLTLAENPQETLTEKLWTKWQTDGYTTRPNALTYIEVSNLTAHFLKTCRQQNIDYQEYDFQTLIDHNLNYYENQSAITEAVGSPLSEAEQYHQWVKEAQQEKETQEQLAEKNAKLEKQNRTLKAQEKETIDSQQIKREIQQINQNQAAILNQLEQIPNLANLVTALQKSQNFHSVGNALSPLATPPKTRLYAPDDGKPIAYTYHGEGAEFCQYCGVKLEANSVKCWNCKAPIQQPPKRQIPECIRPKKPIKPLDAFAGTMIFVIWLAASYAILTAGEITAWTVIGLAIFWVFFTIVFRLVAGGILD